MEKVKRRIVKDILKEAKDSVRYFMFTAIHNATFACEDAVADINEGILALMESIEELGYSDDETLRLAQDLEVRLIQAAIASCD